jgi:hypothetical protein
MEGTTLKFSLLGRKASYIFALAALFAAAVGVYLSAPVNTVVEAQRGDDFIKSDLPSRPDRLAIALDFRSAHNLAAFGGGGMVDDGVQMRGERATAKESRQVRADLDRAHSIIKQLDCTQVDGDVTGRTFAPGVYCVPSMSLAGRMTLDGMGDDTSHFVFIVNGSLEATRGSSFQLQNGAAPENAYFWVKDTANIGDGVTFTGTILARGDVTVRSGADIKGRTLSVDGKVTFDGESVSTGSGFGILEICKHAVGGPRDEGSATGLENRIFRFRVGGGTYYAPVGGCTPPIKLATGNALIEELNSGPLIGGAGTDTDWVGRFKLVDVTTNPSSALGTVNLPARTAVVFIREGGINNMTIANFYNQFAILGYIEICKRRALVPGPSPQSEDPDVSGFWDYTIDAIANTVFTVPVGQCSGPIGVLASTFPQPTPPPPGRGLALVTELAKDGFQLDSVSTFSADRLQNVIFNFGIRNTTACSNIGTSPIPPGCLFANPGGGIADVLLVEGSTPSSQTTVNFFNRTRPGRVKVCKIAGPGIPIGTWFTFNWSGSGPANPFPGPQLPAQAVSGSINVQAGPASQGGFCQFIDQLFIIGTNVTVVEVGVTPATAPTPNLSPINGVAGEVRVSRIRLDQQVTCGPASNNTTALCQAWLNAKSITFQARREIREVEYTNYVFRPTLLKICKIAGEGVAVNTPFSFSFLIDSEGGLFAPPLSIAVPNLTVNAGPAAQGGFCAFAQGPYTPTSTVPPVGTFRVGSIVDVLESTVAGTAVSSITSPTNSPLFACLPPNVANSRCRAIGLLNPGGFNELTFTNIKAPVAQRAPFDFDGDGKTDISVTRHSGSSRWYQLRSGDGYTFTQFDLGQTGDLVVPADYNGDGKTEAGVFRPSTGDWWVLNEGESVAVAMNAGMVGDIPLPSDYTGDGKADFVLYRPSTGQWFRYENGSTNTSHMAFGMAGDKPLIGDFDGDGKADPAIFRSSTGTFWYAASSEGNAHRAAQWGMNGDTAVTGDYDGDGKTDLAVFRPSNGTWWILNSSTGQMTGLQWGMNGDKPIAADYDGDGKADVAVYRPSNGTWYIIKSGSGFQGFVWGVSTDIPTPGAFVP